MGTLVGALPVGQLSAGALIALVVLLILTGWLIPRWVLRQVAADRDYWRASADTWQKVATENGMTLEKHTATLEKLLTYAETTQHIVSDLQRAGQP